MLFELPLLVQEVLVDLEIGQNSVLRLEDLHAGCFGGGGVVCLEKECVVRSLPNLELGC